LIPKIGFVSLSKIVFMSKQYEIIVSGYYNEKDEVRGFDIITGNPFTFDDRPDTRQRIEKCINSKEYLGIYKRGTRNGYDYLTSSDLKDIGVEVTTKPKVVNNLPWLVENKPTDFIIDDLKWKFISRNIHKNKNLMLVGPSGCGKTQITYAIAKQQDRPIYYFNLGSTQDARTSLIGSVQLDVKSGTYFNPSAFIQAIQKPNSIILLDELSRANPDAWNILMPVLDVNLRELRVDENIDYPPIKVADNVSFVATANIGVEYTSTRVLDRALTDRFVSVEMNPLDKLGIIELLNNKYPSLPPNIKEKIAQVSEVIQREISSPDSELSSHVSTRSILEFAEMIGDGFSFDQALDLIVYPLFDDDGGVESERVYCRQLIQKIHNPLTNSKTTPNEIFDMFGKTDDDYPIVDDLLKK